MAEPVTISSKQVARGIELPLEKIESVIKLLDEGYPVPFIARYRKDVTGNLDETQIRDIEERLHSMRLLAERKQVILKAIESLGKLTPELDQKIRDARTPKRLEDLYLPYKPKRETLASAAKAKGLEPLALEILEGKLSQEQLDVRVKDFVDADKGVKTEADALLGAGHILGEVFSEKVELRQKIRDIIQRSSKLISKRILPESESTDEEPEKTTVKVQTAEEEQVAEKVQIPEKEPSASKPEPEKAEPDAAPAAETGVTEEEREKAKEETEETKENDQTPSPTVESQTVELQISEAQFVDSQVSETQVPEIPISEPLIPETQVLELQVVVTTFPLLPSSSDLEPTEPGQAESGQNEGPDVNPAAPSPTVVLPETEAPQISVPSKKKPKKKITPQEERRLAEQEKLYNDYFDFSVDFKKLPPYRVLAINRGEKAKVLRVRFEHDKAAIEQMAMDFCVPQDHPLQTFLFEAAKDALQRLLLPALEREARRDLTENAEQQAVLVFAKNLRNLLLQPPLDRKRVLAIDPGLRHGCKTVALDEFGNILAYETIYIAGKGAKKGVAAETVVKMIQQYKLSVIAVGNGTGCREAESFVVKLIANQLTGHNLGYIVVNEAGASIYSVSPAAKEEFPNYDVMLRGAISIGRRLQDPLNELVKIEPGHLGVGMYQHDVKAKHLQESLEKVVESCVNHIGVDLNRATPAILRYVAGLNQLTAKRVYDYRQQNGPFRSREQLKNISGFGEVTYTYAAGFLKIRDGAQPLDATWIHPESYGVAVKILEKIGFTGDDLRNNDQIQKIAEALKTFNASELATEFGVGLHSIQDIIGQLGRPGRDPREELPPPVFKTGILHMDDLQPGAELTGTVLNVVDFGAFVDVGLHESGLIHISHMANKYVRDAHEVLSVGDSVKVWVVEVDKERKRISLSMLPPGTERKRERREPREPREDRRRSSQQDRPPRPRGEDTRGPRPARESGTGGEQQQQNGEQRPPRPPRDNRNGERQQGQGERQGERQGNYQRNERQSRPAPENRRDRPRQEDRRRDDGRRDGGRGRRTDRFERPKSFEVSSKKTIKPITEEMKKGTAPMRSFSDLAQFFGRVEAPGPEEEKRKQKELARLQRVKQNSENPETQNPEAQEQKPTEQVSQQEHVSPQEGEQPVQDNQESNS